MLTTENIVQPLLKWAIPELYRRNPFRLTGLPLSATGREIGRYLEKLKLHEKLGTGAAPSSGLLPIDPPPDFDMLREAVQTIQKDPEIRLLHEFFWLWPLHDEKGQPDPHLALLEKGEVNAAERSYKELSQTSGHRSSIAKHNLAVLAHLQALDLEWQAEQKPLSDPQEILRARRWLDATSAWHAALTDGGVWQWLDARVHELNDPRLTEQSVRSLREDLPLLLCLISARLAVRSAGRGALAQAEGHVSHVNQAFADAAHRDRALRTAITPVIEQITALCQQMESRSKEAADKGAGIATQLFEESKPLLMIVETVLPGDHPSRESAHDQIALCGLGILIAYGNTTNQWATCLDLLEQCERLAKSDSARGRIKEISDTVKSNTTCWFCEKAPGKSEKACTVPMYGNVTDQGSRVTWSQLDVDVPRCKTCRAAHAIAGVVTGVVNWVVGAIALVGGLVGGPLTWGLLNYWDTFGTLDRRMMNLGFLFSFFISLLLCAPIGFFVELRLYFEGLPRFTLKPGTKAEASVFDFPRIKARLSEGWKIGKTPPEVA